MDEINEAERRLSLRLKHNTVREKPAHTVHMTMKSSSGKLTNRKA